MFLRVIGASCILTVCGGVGFMLAERHMKELRSMRQLIRILDFMENELLFNLPALPFLCRQAAEETGGVLKRVFISFAQELENQISPNADMCMQAAVNRSRDIPAMTRSALLLLGGQLGRFDLQGQVKGLQTLRQTCLRKLKELEQNKDSRVRSYKTLGLCAGAALVILFI